MSENREQVVARVNEVLDALEKLNKLNLDWMDRDDFDSMVEQVADLILQKSPNEDKLDEYKRQALKADVGALVDRLRGNDNDDEDDDGPTILQNAIWVCELQEILVSTHVHDYVSRQVGENYYMVDGGHEYLRRSVNKPGLVVDLTIYSNSTLAEKVQRLVWGTRGKNGDQKKKFVLLRQCETDHLKAILATQTVGALYQTVIETILTMRETLPDLVPRWGVCFDEEEAAQVEALGRKT